MHRRNAADFDVFDLLLRHYVADAFVPPACGSSLDGAVLARSPFDNFSRCLDLCGKCRYEALRAIDLIETALDVGRPTERLIPETVALSRMALAQAQIEDERRLRVTTQPRWFSSSTKKSESRSLDQMLAEALKNDTTTSFQQLRATIRSMVAKSGKPCSATFIRNALKAAKVKAVRRGVYSTAAAIKAYMSAVQGSRSAPE